jgi:hypothetical protein
MVLISVRPIRVGHHWDHGPDDDGEGDAQVEGSYAKGGQVNLLGFLLGWGRDYCLALIGYNSVVVHG